ncbi:glycine zipper 2TM domain-containing protein [Luteimonas huabeiensis]|uniref:glycine zipper 2TM domain-containing protein n=1 Tax=Luteimonas huabeiensis TaxID=1244513 RepID=UPI0004643126|nr:glycine zipper 2TM domain-containing protein [Luteimonas huabeiensis]
MNMFRTWTGIAALSLASVGAAYAQTYGPQDEGRRFDDGTRVVCEEVEVQRGGSDPNRIGGTAAGAVIGGLIGNQVGSGSGRKLATVGGAVAGGAIGRNVQGNRQEARGDRVVEQRCYRTGR